MGAILRRYATVYRLQPFYTYGSKNVLSQNCKSLVGYVFENNLWLSMHGITLGN